MHKGVLHKESGSVWFRDKEADMWLSRRRVMCTGVSLFSALVLVGVLSHIVTARAYVGWTPRSSLRPEPGGEAGGNSQPGQQLQPQGGSSQQQQQQQQQLPPQQQQPPLSPYQLRQQRRDQYLAMMRARREQLQQQQQQQPQQQQQEQQSLPPQRQSVVRTGAAQQNPPERQPSPQQQQSEQLKHIAQLQQQLRDLEQRTPPRFQESVQTDKLRLAQEWADDPYSFCFQGANDEMDEELTIVTLTSVHMRPDVLSCIRMNRLLVAMEQGARYCHFYNMDPTRAIHWSKILALKQALIVSKHVLWLDSDAIITRFDVSLMKYFLNLTNGKDAVFSTEFDQSMNQQDRLLEMRQDTAKLNTGVMFFRSTNWTIGLLDWVYRFSPASSHWGDPFHDQHGFTDFQRLHRVEWKSHTHVVHYKYINHWEKTYKNGSLIFHSAGGAHKRMKYVESVLPKCSSSNAKSRFAPRLQSMGPSSRSRARMSVQGGASGTADSSGSFAGVSNLGFSNPGGKLPSLVTQDVPGQGLSGANAGAHSQQGPSGANPGAHSEQGPGGANTGAYEQGGGGSEPGGAGSASGSGSTLGAGDAAHAGQAQQATSQGGAGEFKPSI